MNKYDESLWRVITVPVEIEFFLLKWNQLHFGQSEHEATPFTTALMKKKFDWNTSTDEVEAVLNGTYDTEEDAELTEIMKLILTKCVGINPPKKSSPEIMVAQLRGKIKVWREGTTTSPSGRHLGHYKRLFTVIDKSLEATERKELKEIQERIAGFYVATINYAISHNCSYKRWRQILNFMICKEQGNVNIH